MNEKEDCAMSPLFLFKWQNHFTRKFIICQGTAMSGREIVRSPHEWDAHRVWFQRFSIAWLGEFAFVVVCEPTKPAGATRPHLAPYLNS